MDGKQGRRYEVYRECLKSLEFQALVPNFRGGGTFLICRKLEKQSDITPEGDERSSEAAGVCSPSGQRETDEVTGYWGVGGYCRTNVTFIPAMFTV